MSLQVTEKVTLLPTVGPLQNGANAVHSARSVFDTLGRLLWQKSPRGFITFHHYDLTRNVLLRRIEDVSVAVYNNEPGGGEGKPPVPAGWQTPPGGGLHLETVYAHDRQGRTVKETGPVHSVQLSPADAATTPVRQVVYHTYNDAARQRRSARGYVTAPATGTPVYYTVGWVSVQNYDAAGRVVEEFEAVRSGATGETVAGELTATEAFPPSSWRRLRRMGYDDFGRLGWTRVYHQLQISGDGLSIVEGAAGTHYAETLYGYDVMDRQVRVEDASGTITRTVLDARGQALSRWVGTDDTGATDADPNGTGAPNNMVKVETLTYSDATGLLVQHDRHVDAATVRSEFFRYDEFDRLVRHQRGTGASAVLEVYTYDRQNRVSLTQRFHGLTTADNPTATHANFLGQQERSFDSRGLVFKEVAHSANPTTSPGLTTTRWFDAAGNVIKAKSPGSDAAQKVVFDGLERGKARYVVLETEDTPGSGSEGSESSASSSDSSSDSSSSGSIEWDNSSSSDDWTTENNLVGPNMDGDNGYPLWLPPDTSSSSDSSESSSESSSDSSSADPGSESSSSSSAVPPPEDDDDPPTSSSSSSSSSTSFSSDNVVKEGPSPCPCCCDCDDKDRSAECKENQTNTAGSDVKPAVPDSGRPVRLSSGAIDLEEHDLSSTGLSFRWGVTRCYNNLIEEGSGLFGRGWYTEELPVLLREGTDIVMMTGGVRNEWFSPDSGSTTSYHSTFGGLSTLKWEAATATLPSRWVLTTRSGSSLTFFDFDSPSDLEPKCQGRLWAMTNRHGETVAIKWRSGDGTGAPQFVEWATVTGRKVRYDYEIHGEGSSPGSRNRIASVTYKVNTENNGALLSVQRSLYTYWDDGEWGGHGGCLKTVAIQHFSEALNAWTTVREHYYRYYGPDDEDGPAGALKYVFGPAAVARLRRDFPTSWDTLANGLLLRPYADLRFTYDSQRRVRRERVDGFSAAYELSWLHNSATPSGPNDWHSVATVTRPDSSTTTVISNVSGYALLQVFHDAGTGKDWRQAWRYDETTGRLIESIPHSAIATATLPATAGSAWNIGTTPPSGITFNASTGPVTIYDYYGSADNAPGRLKSEAVRAGVNNTTPLPLRQRSYLPAVTGSSQVTPLVSETVHYSATSTVTLHYGLQYAGGPSVGGGGGVPEEYEVPVANDVSTDLVFEQEKPEFDKAGNVLFTTRWLRLHSTADTATGELVAPDDTPQALRSYTALYPDGVGRTHSVADYGTNGGSSLTRSSIPLAPAASSATVLVSRSRSLVAGAPEAYESVAPDGTVTRWENDPAGRRLRLWENYKPALGPEHLDANRLTEYTYHSSGQLSLLTAWNRKSGSAVPAEPQQTRWAYGTTLADSGIATGHLLRAKIYPESDDTATTPPGDGPNGLYRRSEFTYNSLGEVTTFTDPAGTVHEYSHDQHGRLLHDAVTLPDPTPLDSTVLRISRTYADNGRATTITSWDKKETTGATRVNEVRLEFNTWGQLVADRQSHTSTAATTSGVPALLYAYNDGTSGGTQPGPVNSLRRHAMTLPNGREVVYSLTGTTDTRLGRLSAIGYRVSASSVPTELALTYAGVAMPVRMEYPAPTTPLQWTLLAQTGEQTNNGKVPYTGLDNFGRLLQARWLTADASAARVHVNYGYDTGSRRTLRRTVNAADTLPEAEQYTYDGLSQITRRLRGIPHFNNNVFDGVAETDPVPERDEVWTYDVLGNWQFYRVREPHQTIPGTTITRFDHTRTHNEANQITGFSNTTQPLTHDPAGNLTASAPTPDNDWDNALHYQWDAWNRLTKITRSSDGAVIATHAYDGLTRRTTLTENGATRHFYYNDQWRSVEERLGAATVPERQHLFNPLNRWHLILRDRDTDANGTLNERRYSLHDAMDPVALTDTSGAVVERYNYSAFGMRRVMDATFTDRPTGTAHAWNWDFHGEFSDAASGMVNYGYRHYNSLLGRFHCRDPKANARRPMDFCDNNPLSQRDKFGLEPQFPYASTLLEDITEYLEQERRQERESKPSDTSYIEFGTSQVNGIVNPGKCGRVYYDPRRCCCIGGKIYLLSDEIEVDVCIRRIEVMGGVIAEAVGSYHMWIRSSFGEVGMMAEEGTKGNPWDQTRIDIHDGQGDAPRSECFTVKVNTCCIAKVVKNLGPTGKTCNEMNCNKWTESAIKRCGGDWSRVTSGIDAMRYKDAGEPDFTMPVEPGGGWFFVPHDTFDE